MSIALKNEIRELRAEIEELKRKMNIVCDEPRTIAGQPEPNHQPKKHGPKPKGK